MRDSELFYRVCGIESYWPVASATLVIGDAVIAEADWPVFETSTMQVHGPFKPYSPSLMSTSSMLL